MEREVNALLDEKDLQAIAQLIAPLRADISEIKEDLKGVHVELTEVKEDLKGVHEELAGIHKRMDKMQTQMDGMQVQMDGMQTQMDGMQTQIDGIHKRMDGMQEELSEVHEIATKVAVTQEAVVIVHLGALADGHKHLADTLAPKSRVDALEEEVAFVKSALHIVSQDVNELKRAQ